MASSARSQGVSDETSDAVILADLDYAERGETSLQLDLHRPADEAAVPCVLYFHGGAWMAGDRKIGAVERLHPLVARGIAVASVGYRFTDAVTHPGQLDDARAAVHWLAANANDLGLLPGPVGAWGASAGGWIALMLMLTGAGDGPGSVAAACAWFPVTDLVNNIADREAAGLPLPAVLEGRPLPIPSMEARLLGVTDVAEVPELARAASPVGHVANARGPVLLVHGDLDGLVNAAQSHRLHQALVGAGADSQLLLVAGADHQSEEFHTPAIFGAVAAFFTAALVPSRHPQGAPAG